MTRVPNLKCPNCGASASLPLGMTCADHRPMPLYDDPEQHSEEASWVPAGWNDIPEGWATRPITTEAGSLPDMQTLTRVALGEFKR